MIFDIAIVDIPAYVRRLDEHSGIISCRTIWILLIESYPSSLLPCNFCSIGVYSVLQIIGGFPSEFSNSNFYNVKRMRCLQG